MTRGSRHVLFGAGATALGGLLAWAVTGLPDFGAKTSAYAAALNHTAVAQRHATNVVAAIVFDYRGVDTFGEELIVLGAVFGVALLLRESREQDIGRPRDESDSDLVRAIGLGGAGVALLVGLYVVAHGYVTPGGGFQGGVTIASAFALVYLAGGFRSFKRLTPVVAVDAVEGVGAGIFAGAGVAALVLGYAFLANLMPGSLGMPGTLASAGSIPLVNAAAAIEVAAGFVLLLGEFLEELEAQGFE
jgi:multicomponent Na+:H+ antiporter subunit B